MYKKVFRCKLCGALIYTVDIKDVITANIELTNNMKESLIPHYCMNGDLGIAEVIGYKKIGS